MKKKKMSTTQNDDMLPEYNFEGKTGIRGKYIKDVQKGYSVHVLKQDNTVAIKHFIPKEDAIILDKDVKTYFPDSRSVNTALRRLIRQTRKEAKSAVMK